VVFYHIVPTLRRNFSSKLKFENSGELSITLISICIHHQFYRNPILSKQAL